MVSRDACGQAKDEEQRCALRALNICDGSYVVELAARRWAECYCATEQLLREVGWTGAADSYAKERDEAVARAGEDLVPDLRRS